MRRVAPLGCYHYMVSEGNVYGQDPATSATPGCGSTVDLDGSSGSPCDENLNDFAGDFGRSDCSNDCTGDFDCDSDVDGTDLDEYSECP